MSQEVPFPSGFGCGVGGGHRLLCVRGLDFLAEAARDE